MPAIGRNLLPGGCLTPRPDRGPSHSPWVNVVSIPSDFMTSRFARACIGPGSRPLPGYRTQPTSRPASPLDHAAADTPASKPYPKRTERSIVCVIGSMHSSSHYRKDSVRQGPFLEDSRGVKARWVELTNSGARATREIKSVRVCPLDSRSQPATAVTAVLATEPCLFAQPSSFKVMSMLVGTRVQ